MIAAVASLRERVALRLALEVGARHVIEQQVVGEVEEFAQALHQVLLEGFLVGQQPVQGTVEPVIVHAIGGNSQQVFERRAAIPVFRNVKLTRRLAQPRDDQYRGHRGPRHLLSAVRKMLLAKLVQPQRLPQPPAEPDITERATPFDANVIESKGRRRLRARGVLEQLALIAPAGDLSRERLRVGAAFRVQFAELRHGLLHDLAVAANRTNQAPVDVLLAILPNRRMSEIHDRTPPRPNVSARAQQGKGESWYYTRIPSPLNAISDT